MSSTASLAVLEAGGARLANPAEPVVRADDNGLLRGESVFETTRVLSGVPVDLAAHLRRLAVSARAVDVTFPAAHDVAATVRCALGGWSAADGVLRIVVTKGGEDAPPRCFALITRVPSNHAELRRAGIAAMTLTLGVSATLRAGAPWLLGGIKSTSYAPAMAAQRASAERGSADAIWVSGDGELLEGTTSAVLVARDGELSTPPAGELALLPSLTLARLRLLVDIPDRRVRRDELGEADEVLLVGSVRGVVPVTSLDGMRLGIGRYGSSLPAALETNLRAAQNRLPG